MLNQLTNENLLNKETIGNPLRKYELHELKDYAQFLSQEILVDVKTDNSKKLLLCVVDIPISNLKFEDECLILEEVFKELVNWETKKTALEFMETRKELRLRDEQYQAYLNDPYQLARD